MFGEGNPNFGKKHPNIHSLEVRKRMGDNMRGSKNPMFGKSTYSDIGYRDDINLRVRSTWEANVARILMYKNLDWKYEPESFELPELNTTYRPDFVLTKGNRKCYIEVKGYLREESIRKIKEFKRLYKNFHFLLLDTVSYNKLKDKYSDKIQNWEYGTTAIRGRNLKFEFDSIIKIKSFPWGKRKCYNISVEDDESFISNHIVTHNTSKMPQGHPYLYPALLKNRALMMEKFSRAMDEAITKAAVGKYYGGGKKGLLTEGVL
jgi:hypothetical protein